MQPAPYHKPSTTADYAALLAGPELKARLRRDMSHLRHVQEPNVAVWPMVNRLRRLLSELQPEVVGVYLAQNNEPDLSRLWHELPNLGFSMALPRVVGDGFPLTYNFWHGQPADDWDTAGNPCANGREVTPGVIITPALAFDASGNRLGPGGGRLDLTLKALNLNATAITVAYSFQQVDSLPREYHDVPVDYIVTERDLIRCRGVL